MLTVTNKAASLLKVAKTAEGAPQDAGIRLCLDTGFKAPGVAFVEIGLAVSDGPKSGDEEFEQDGHDPTGTLHRSGVRFILRAREQLVRTIRQEIPSANPKSEIHNPQSTIRNSVGMPRRADRAGFQIAGAAFHDPRGHFLDHLLEQQPQMRAAPVIGGGDVPHPVGMRGKLVAFLETRARRIAP